MALIDSLVQAISIIIGIVFATYFGSWYFERKAKKYAKEIAKYFNLTPMQIGELKLKPKLRCDRCGSTLFDLSPNYDKLICANCGETISEIKIRKKI